LARVLFTTFGSYGDIHPYMAIGIELQRRGHAVTIATSPSYAAKITSEGLAFHAVRPDVSLHDNALLAYVMDARRGSERVLRYISSGVRESYEDTLPAVRQADLIVTHPITFGAVLAAEKLGVPWISSVLAPISFLVGLGSAGTCTFAVAHQSSRGGPWIHAIYLATRQAQDAAVDSAGRGTSPRAQIAGSGERPLRRLAFATHGVGAILAKLGGTAARLAAANCRHRLSFF